MKVNYDQIMPATSPRQDALEINPVTLSFSGDLEKSFRDDYFASSINMVRVSLLAGIVLYGFFGILDAQLVPAAKEELWIIRFGIVCPFLFAVICFSYSRFFKKFFQIVVTGAMMVSGSAIIFMITIIPPPVNHSYYVGLILVFIWGYTFTRVRFVWATSAGWILVVFYEIAANWIVKTPMSIQISNNFFFISSNIVGMFACYSIEYYTRKHFFLAFQLEKEKDKVKSANQRLEKIVQERTSQLIKKNRELELEIEERKSAENKRTELESQLQEAQKLESLGTLAGGIAHDFNNLLMGIQGNVSLMLLEANPNGKQYERLRSSEQYVLKGAELTRQLLGFARGGKYEVKPTKLNELIKKSSDLFGRTKKEIAIHQDFVENLWVVNVDRGQIEQVLLNLFVNAWHAMPDGGEILIRTENVNIDKTKTSDADVKPGEYVKTCVKDTGVGMDYETQQRIFDPFFTTKDMDRGTGLGLASAYGIIKNHEGFFEVESQLGKGSSFSFFLPASDACVVPQGKESPREIISGKEKILLVDDEEMVINVAGEMLDELGYQVEIARSGKEAIEKYSSYRSQIDMVILDLIMPGMSGTRTYRALKEINPHVKVLFSSGYSITGDLNHIISCGSDGFIQKPFDIHGLSQKIREVMEQNAIAMNHSSDVPEALPV